MIRPPRPTPFSLHSPETIQPFGVLLAFNHLELKLERCSANAGELLGRPQGDLAGLPLADALTPAIATLIAATPPAPSGGTLLHERFTAPDGTSCSVIFFHSGRHLIVELERAEETAEESYELLCRTQAGVEILRNIADPAVMMARIARVFRDITGYDRVLLFRFDKEWNRDIVAEERSAAAPGTFLGLRVPADALPTGARILYQRAGVRLIPDIDAAAAPIVTLANPDAREWAPLDLSDSGLRSTSPEHAAHLEKLGVRASLTMAIEVAGHLWGMVTAHHYQPRRLSALRRAACRLLATAIAAPLAALSESSEARDRTRWMMDISQAASDALERVDGNDRAFAHFARRLADITGATGVLIRAGSVEVAAGTLPGRALLDRIVETARAHGDGGIFVTESLSAIDPALTAVRDIASGAVAVDLPLPHDGITLLLRGEIPEEIVWASDGAQSDSGPAWGVVAQERLQPGVIPPPRGDGPRIERSKGVARAWPERLLPLLPITRQTVLDICRLMAERETLATIRRRENELRTIYESVDEGIALVEPGGRIIRCNQPFLQLLGMEEETVTGRTIDSLIEVTEPAGVARLLDIGRGKGRPRESGGGRHPLEIRATLTSRGPGGLHTVVVRDISHRELFERELVRAREAAEKANRAKDEFLANMSHELRTPLTAVLGYIDLLDQQLRDPTQRKWIDTIRRSGWSLLRLLSDVVDFARIDAGEIRLEFGVLDPVGKAHSIIDLFRPTLDEKGVRAEVRVAPGVPRAVIGDAARMRQILSNLVGNAVKFTREGTIAIDIAAGPPDRDGQFELEFTVSDTGIGIAGENLDALFDRFSQADASSTRSFGGVGLGLAIARGLARRMGGEVEAESGGLGKGARFRLRLPVRSATRAATGPSLPPARPRVRGRILIIEDDQVNQELLAEMTRILGFVPEIAGTGELGVEAAASMPGLAALLVDVSLPGMNGMEAIRRVRALAGPVAQVPVVCVTALASERDRTEALAAGADAYLTKPVRLADLRSTLERVTVERPAARSQPGAWE